MGGNVANGSPIGDSAPVLMALDAAGRAAPGPSACAACRWTTSTPATRPTAWSRASSCRPSWCPTRRSRASSARTRSASASTPTSRPSSRRWPSRWTASRVADVRLVFGGMAAVVKRAATAEAVLRGQPWSAATLAAAQAALARDFTPLDDMRASAAYRLRVAQNLLQRFWLETQAGAAASCRRRDVDLERRMNAGATSRSPEGSGLSSAPRHERPRRDSPTCCDAERRRGQTPPRTPCACAGARRRRRMTGTAPRFLEPPHASAGVGASRPHESAHLHVAGAATYIDDIPELAGTLHCALGLSPVAHGRLRSMDLDRIRALPGVVDVFSAADIPGHNDCGPDPARRPDPGRRRAAPRRPAGVRGRRAHARGRAPRGREGARGARHRAAGGRAHAARRARPRPVRDPAHPPGARHDRRRRAGRDRRGAAPAGRLARRRRPGAVLPRGPDQLRGARPRTTA